MPRDASLRRRITLSTVLLPIVLCTLFAGASVVLIHSIEREVIAKRLNDEFTRLMNRARNGLPPELPTGVELLESSALPESMRYLAPGLHEQKIEERAYHVLIREVDDRRWILTDDQSGFEQLETNLYVGVAATFLVALALALLIGRLTAVRAISPLIDLANAVESEVVPEAFPALSSSDEVGVLARTLRSRTEALNRSLTREQLFTGDVSHELRTPITVILGAAELLLLKLTDRPDLLENAERIHRNALEMTLRVTALLLLSRAPDMIDAPRVEARHIVEQEMLRCHPLLANKPVQLNLESPEEVWVFARPELVSMAVGNLLRNACQFTESGAVVVRLDTRNVTVEDTGPGIPEDLRDHLFDRFARGKQEYETGSGLGLAIVMRIAEHLGWTLNYEQVSNGGSRFVLSIPPA